MDMETMLKERIEGDFQELRETEIGSDERKAAVDELTVLMDRAIEIQKFEDERKDRLIRNILTASGIVIPTAVTIWGTIKSIEFEKEGTITTIMGRGFINKLIPKK